MTVNKSRTVSDKKHVVLYPLINLSIITAAILPYESISQSFLYCHMWHYNKYLVISLGWITHVW